MKELKKRSTIINKMDSNSMSIRFSMDKTTIKYDQKYSGKPEKGINYWSCNIWGKDADGIYAEDEVIEKLKSDICKSIDDQRKIIVNELKKAGVYEPADV